MNEALNRLVKRVLIELTPDDDLRGERIKACEEEELARTATRH
jgi:hypothetical protein